MNKQAWRQQLIHQMQSLDVNYRKTIEKRMTEQLLASPYWESAEVIGITISQGFEWDTRMIIEAGWNQGKNICVPKCNPKSKELVFYIIESYDQLETVYYNLLEPIPTDSHRVNKTNINLLVVPGLVFDERGYRIGFGGGYYDRFLTNFPNQTVSLLHPIQFTKEIPAEPFDRSVEHLIIYDG